jgi:hypothetical protein
MPQAFVAADVHEPFDVHGHLAAQATLNFVASLDDRAQAIDLFFSQVIDAHLRVYTGLFNNAIGRSITDPKYIRQSYRNPLIAG